MHEFITTGVSSIDVSVSPLSCSPQKTENRLNNDSASRFQHDTPRSSGQQFGFEIMINASVEDAPALCCAAETEADFMMWMQALTSVIDGSLDD